MTELLSCSPPLLSLFRGMAIGCRSLGLSSLSYIDPDERSPLCMLWHAEDLPWMAEDYDGEEHEVEA
jgi:hypothetical protein